LKLQLIWALVRSQVVELQIALDEYKEKYRAIARATNAQAHTKKLQVLEYNMGQLHEVQRGVSAPVQCLLLADTDRWILACKPKYQS
jgi:hypothetical protein